MLKSYFLAGQICVGVSDHILTTVAFPRQHKQLLNCAWQSSASMFFFKRCFRNAVHVESQVTSLQLKKQHRRARKKHRTYSTASTSIKQFEKFHSTACCAD